MLKSVDKSSTKIFWIVTLAIVIITSFAMLALGNLVGRSLESVMILHDFFTAVAVMSGAGIIGILIFSNQIIKGSITSIQILAILSTISVFLVIFTGVIGYVYYRLPNEDSPKSKILKIFPYAHEPLFETMEYLGLLGSIWATLISYLIIHYKERLFTSKYARYTVTSMIAVGILYALMISLTGLIPAKIASVQG